MALARALARTKKAAARSSRRDASGAFARRAFRGLTPFGCTSFGGRARFRGRTCCAGRAQIFLQLFEVAQDGLVHLLDVATCVPQEPRYVFAKVLSACPDAAADRTQLLLGGLECCLKASDRTSVLLEACTRGCGHTWASSRFIGDRFTRGCCFGSGGFPSFGFTYWRHRCSFVLELQHALPPRFKLPEEAPAEVPFLILPGRSAQIAFSRVQADIFWRFGGVRSADLAAPHDRLALAEGGVAAGDRLHIPLARVARQRGQPLDGRRAGVSPWPRSDRPVRRSSRGTARTGALDAGGVWVADPCGASSGSAGATGLRIGLTRAHRWNVAPAETALVRRRQLMMVMLRLRRPRIPASGPPPRRGTVSEQQGRRRGRPSAVTDYAECGAEDAGAGATCMSERRRSRRQALTSASAWSGAPLPGGGAGAAA